MKESKIDLSRVKYFSLSRRRDGIPPHKKIEIKLDDGVFHIKHGGIVFNENWIQSAFKARCVESVGVIGK